MPGSIADGELSTKLLLGRYRVVKRLAEGGMGTVYLSRTEGAEGFTRPVVIKRMKAEMRSSDAEKLFTREANILSRLQHPGILNIIDFGIEDGAYVMVLDYVHGYSLMQWLDYRYAIKRPIPVDICLFITRNILGALNYAHHFSTEDGQNLAIVHRDVAPDNVLLSRQGHVRLLDFGIAKMHGAGLQPTTKSGVFRGKLGYASPESLEGEEATPRSDQYSAGVVLLELLTFESPFAGASMAESVQKMMNEVPPAVSTVRSGVPPGLDEVVARAIEKSPGKRFGSVLEFSTALRQLQQKSDEEVLPEFAALLQEDFELLPKELNLEPLKSLEAALSSPLPAIEEREERGAFEHRAATRPPGRGSAELTHRENRSLGSSGSKKWPLVGLIAGGAAVALGALAARGGGFGSASEGAPVVIGGSVAGTVSPNGTTNEAESPGTKRPGAEEPGAKGNGSASANGERPVTSVQEQLATALQSQSAAIESCFAKHISGAEAPPRAHLHFQVPAGRGETIVRVEPRLLVGTPLGECLEAAGRAVHFPEQANPIGFRVPVVARVSELHAE